MRTTTTPDAAAKLASYPTHVQPTVAALRQLILETAERAGVAELQETLKWGEPELDQPLPRRELEECIRMALCYHDLKGEPLLGYADDAHEEGQR